MVIILNNIGKIYIQTEWQNQWINKNNMSRNLKQLFKLTRTKILKDMFELKIRNIRAKWDNTEFKIFDKNTMISGTYIIYATTLKKSDVSKIFYYITYINSNKVKVKSEYIDNKGESFTDTFEEAL